MRFFLLPFQYVLRPKNWTVSTHPPPLLFYYCNIWSACDLQTAITNNQASSHFGLLAALGSSEKTVRRAAIPICAIKLPTSPPVVYIFLGCFSSVLEYIFFAWHASLLRVLARSFGIFLVKVARVGDKAVGIAVRPRPSSGMAEKIRHTFTVILCSIHLPAPFCP